MSYRDVLKVFKLERELSDDETALLNTLRDMTDAERELLAETLGPPVKAKVSKPATKKLKQCDICGISKRAAHHRDVNHPDYHEFDAGGPRSACLYAIPSLNGKICGADINQPIHHDQVIKTYHEFQPSSKPKSARASSIAEKLPKPLGQGVKADEYEDVAAKRTKPALCAYEIDGKVCHGEEDDGIHDKSLGYGNYHPFVSSSSARPARDQSSTSDSAVSSGIDSEDVSVAVGG